MSAKTRGTTTDKNGSYSKYKSGVQIGNVTEEDGAVGTDYPQTLDPPVDALYLAYSWEDRGTWIGVNDMNVTYKDTDGNQHVLGLSAGYAPLPVQASEIVSIESDSPLTPDSWYMRSGCIGLRKT